MLLLLVLWIITTFIFLTIGDLFISVSNFLSNRKERYGILDSFILGMCCILFPLGISSIWLPSNENMLAIYLLTCILYWIVRSARLIEEISNLKKHLVTLTFLQIVLMATIIAAMLAMSMWVSYVFDAVNYQYQMTHWYEQYHAIPGLVNIESRLGFNSNYFLISSLFSLPGRFGEPIFILQSLFATLFACWIIFHIIKSNYEIKGLILLILYSIFIGCTIDTLATSSTDILPSLLVFYLIAKMILYPDKFHSQYLLFFITPMCLFTIKLSIVPILLLSAYITYYLLKGKNYKALVFLSILSICVVFPWLVRNVIVSGYLIYPLSEIDIFDFDWKAPLLVAELEQDYIRDYAWHEFEVNSTFLIHRIAMKVDGLFVQNKTNLIFSFITIIISFIAYLSPLAMGYNMFKQRRSATYYLAGITLVTTILVWFSAPDFRFILGTLFAATFLVSVSFFNKNKHYPFVGNLLLFIFAGAISIGAAKRTLNYYHELKDKTLERSFISAFYKPYGIQVQKSISNNDFEIYKMGEIDIYLSPSKLSNATYDFLPSTFTTKYVEDLKETSKFYPIQGVESRGSVINDGFRPIANYNKHKWVREKNWWREKNLVQESKNILQQSQ